MVSRKKVMPEQQTKTEGDVKSGGGWPNTLVDEIDGVQRIVITCEGEGDGNGEEGGLDFMSMTLPCAYDSFVTCVS